MSRRINVGLLAAVGAAMSVLAALAPTHVILALIAGVAGAATGLGGYLSLSPIKKISPFPDHMYEKFSWPGQLRDHRLARRFAARVSGLALGLALAVRPAGLAEVSRVKGGS
jgi:hypothetical protein